MTGFCPDVLGLGRWNHIVNHVTRTAAWKLCAVQCSAQIDCAPQGRIHVNRLLLLCECAFMNSRLQQCILKCTMSRRRCCGG